MNTSPGKFCNWTVINYITELETLKMKTFYEYIAYITHAKLLIELFSPHDGAVSLTKHI